MKHTKIFFALLVLAAAVLAFGCKQANGSSSFTMNEKQTAAYTDWIKGLENNAAVNEISADIVKTSVITANAVFATLDFKVTDNEAGKPITKGTKTDALKKRFVPSAK